MNWFTREVVGGASTERKQALLNQDGGCDHVEKDVNLATVLRSEKDSFGPVGTYLCCSACDKAADEAEGNENCVCGDCKMTVKKKDGFEWRWYDFYAAQGDEALFLCNACRVLPKHLDRVARDRADYEAEFPSQTQDDGPVDNSDDGDWGDELPDAPEEEDRPQTYAFICHTCRQDVVQETLSFDHSHNLQCRGCQTKALAH